jgi:hypothetical protein
MRGLLSAIFGGSSDDTMVQQTNGAETQIDISQMFADVSRTVSGLKNIFGQAGIMDSSSARLTDVSAGDGGSSQSLFGNTCLKACGMEDIQEAAKVRAIGLLPVERTSC